MGLVAFSLMLVVAAFEARSETGTALRRRTPSTARKMNMIAVAEVAGAFLITQADFMRRLLGTDAADRRAVGASRFSPPSCCSSCWEAGKWIARRRTGQPCGRPAVKADQRPRSA